MIITNETRRQIMAQAWDFHHGEPTRAFSDCLRSAWKFVRSMAAYAAKFMKRARRSVGRIAFSPSLITTPIGRASTTTRHPVRADWHAARITSRVGW